MIQTLFAMLARSKNKTLNGNPIVFYDYEDQIDDEDTGKALKVCSRDEEVIITGADRIKRHKTGFTVSIGATDHEIICQ